MTQQSAPPAARRLAVPDYINIGVFSALYFVIVALCALVSNIIFGVAGAALRGLGHAMVPAVITVVGTCLFRFVWLWTFFRRWGTFVALMCVYPVSWVLTSVMMMAAYFVVRKRAFAKIG